MSAKTPKTRRYYNAETLRSEIPELWRQRDYRFFRHVIRSNIRTIRRMESGSG